MHQVRHMSALVAALAILVAVAALKLDTEARWTVVPACIGAIALLSQYFNAMRTRRSRSIVLVALGIGLLGTTASAITSLRSGPVLPAAGFALTALALLPLIHRARLLYRQIPYLLLSHYYR